MTAFLLVRHAESTWNAAGRWQGWADPPLSPRGLAQARALARSLADEAFDVLVSSDLRRARQTAVLLGRVLRRTPLLEPRLRELDVGRWQGLRRDRIAALDAAALARFDGGDPRARAGGGESRAELARRAREALAELAATHAGRRLAVVTHRGVVRTLLPGAALDNAGYLRVSANELGSSECSAAGGQETGSPALVLRGPTRGSPRR